MWQRQAGEWCIHSPRAITIHYTSMPVSSPIVIYSCPVIRPAKKKVDLFTLSVSSSLCLEYIPQRITLHAVCMSPGVLAKFSAMTEKSQFVLLEKLLFSYVIEALIEHTFWSLPWFSRGFHDLTDIYNLATAYLLLIVHHYLLFCEMSCKFTGINVLGVAEKVSRLVKIWQEVLMARPSAKYVRNDSQN